MELKGCTVAPFILRGVSLRGIESVFLDMTERQRIYETYTPVLMKSGKLDLVTHGEDQIVELAKVPEISQKMLDCQIKGRFVVKL